MQFSGLKPSLDGSIKPQCQICQKFGHVAKACYFRYDPDPSYQGRPSTFQAYVANPASSASTSSEWILDSGATNHVRNDLNNLSSFFNYDGNDMLQIGNGAGLPIRHIGSSKLSFSHHSISLTKILHVPQFSKNLISLSQLLIDNPQLTIEFSNFSCYFKDPLTKTTIIQVPCTNGLFSLSSPSTSPPQALLGVRASVDTWHARFGHPSPTSTLHLVQNANLPCNCKNRVLVMIVS